MVVKFCELSSALEKSYEKLALKRSALECDVTQPKVVMCGIGETL